MNSKKYAAEAIGTFWLVLGGCGSAVLAAAFPEVGIGRLGVALAFAGAFAASPVLAAGKIALGVAEFKNESGAGWWRGGVGWELSGMLSNELASSGNFTIAGVTPGRYSINGVVPSPGGMNAGRAGGAAAAGQGGTAGQGGGPAWTLKSAMAGGRDILDFPFVIEPNQEIGQIQLTFTDRTQELSGTLQDSSGRPGWVTEAMRPVAARA